MSESFEKAVEAAAEEHRRQDGAAGGHYEPAEAWIECSCGATVWTWQQLYYETEEDPEEAWTKHLLRAALPHLTAQDVPHVAREAWDEGYDRALHSHCDALDLDGQCDVEDPNPYAEEADHE